MARSSRPSPRLLRSRSPRRSGQRETRLAKQKPLTMNAAATALRAASAGVDETQRDQSVPGVCDSSQAWKPVRESTLRASSTAPSGVVHATTT